MFCNFSRQFYEKLWINYVAPVLRKNTSDKHVLIQLPPFETASRDAVCVQQYFSIIWSRESGKLRINYDPKRARLLQCSSRPPWNRRETSVVCSTIGCGSATSIIDRRQKVNGRRINWRINHDSWCVCVFIDSRTAWWYVFCKPRWGSWCGHCIFNMKFTYNFRTIMHERWQRT